MLDALLGPLARSLRDAHALPPPDCDVAAIEATRRGLAVGARVVPDAASLEQLDAWLLHDVTLAAAGHADAHLLVFSKVPLVPLPAYAGRGSPHDRATVHVRFVAGSHACTVDAASVDNAVSIMSELSSNSGKQLTLRLLHDDPKLRPELRLLVVPADLATVTVPEDCGQRTCVICPLHVVLVPGLVSSLDFTPPFLARQVRLGESPWRRVESLERNVSISASDWVRHSGHDRSARDFYASKGVFFTQREQARLSAAQAHVPPAGLVAQRSDTYRAPATEALPAELVEVVDPAFVPPVLLFGQAQLVEVLRVALARGLHVMRALQPLARLGLLPHGGGEFADCDTGADGERPVGPAVYDVGGWRRGWEQSQRRVHAVGNAAAPSVVHYMPVQLMARALTTSSVAQLDGLVAAAPAGGQCTGDESDDESDDAAAREAGGAGRAATPPPPLPPPAFPGVLDAPPLRRPPDFPGSTGGVSLPSAIHCVDEAEPPAASDHCRLAALGAHVVQAALLALCCGIPGIVAALATTTTTAKLGGDPPASVLLQRACDEAASHENLAAAAALLWPVSGGTTVGSADASDVLKLAMDARLLQEAALRGPTILPVTGAPATESLTMNRFTRPDELAVSLLLATIGAAYVGSGFGAAKSLCAALLLEPLRVALRQELTLATGSSPAWLLRQERALPASSSSSSSSCALDASAAAGTAIMVRCAVFAHAVCQGRASPAAADAPSAAAAVCDVLARQAAAWRALDPPPAQLLPPTRGLPPAPHVGALMTLLAGCRSGGGGGVDGAVAACALADALGASLIRLGVASQLFFAFPTLPESILSHLTSVVSDGGGSPLHLAAQCRLAGLPAPGEGGFSLASWIACEYFSAMAGPHASTYACWPVEPPPVATVAPAGPPPARLTAVLQGLRFRLPGALVAALQCFVWGALRDVAGGAPHIAAFLALAHEDVHVAAELLYARSGEYPVAAAGDFAALMRVSDALAALEQLGGWRRADAGHAGGPGAHSLTPFDVSLSSRGARLLLRLQATPEVRRGREKWGALTSARLDGRRGQLLAATCPQQRLLTLRDGAGMMGAAGWWAVWSYLIPVPPHAAALSAQALAAAVTVEMVDAPALPAGSAAATGSSADDGYEDEPPKLLRVLLQLPSAGDHEEVVDTACNSVQVIDEGVLEQAVQRAELHEDVVVVQLPSGQRALFVSVAVRKVEDAAWQCGLRRDPQLRGLDVRPPGLLRHNVTEALRCSLANLYGMHRKHGMGRMGLGASRGGGGREEEDEEDEEEEESAPVQEAAGVPVSAARDNEGTGVGEPVEPVAGAAAIPSGDVALKWRDEGDQLWLVFLVDVGLDVAEVLLQCPHREESSNGGVVFPLQPTIDEDGGALTLLLSSDAIPALRVSVWVSRSSLSCCVASRDDQGRKFELRSLDLPCDVDLAAAATAAHAVELCVGSSGGGRGSICLVLRLVKTQLALLRGQATSPLLGVLPQQPWQASCCAVAVASASGAVRSKLSFEWPHDLSLAWPPLDCKPGAGRASAPAGAAPQIEWGTLDDALLQRRLRLLAALMAAAAPVRPSAPAAATTWCVIAVRLAGVLALCSAGDATRALADWLGRHECTLVVLAPSDSPAATRLLQLGPSALAAHTAGIALDGGAASCLELRATLLSCANDEGAAGHARSTPAQWGTRHQRSAAVDDAVVDSSYAAVVASLLRATLRLVERSPNQRRQAHAAVQRRAPQSAALSDRESKELARVDAELGDELEAFLAALRRVRLWLQGEHGARRWARRRVGDGLSWSSSVAH